jgi:hypothetical protein
MISISKTALFIINAVRLYRFELGVSQRNISEKISPNAQSNLLGDIESEKRSNQYTDDHLNIIAIEFTTVAKNANGKLKGKDFTVFDFYPAQPIDDSMVEKKIIRIPIDLSPMGMINALIEEGEFFKNPVTVKEITIHCNELSSNNWKTTNFTAQLENAVKYNKLIRLELADGSVKYQQL